MNFTTKLKFGDGKQVVIYRSTFNDGQHFFAYLLCDAQGYQKICDAYYNRIPARSMSEYGEIIYFDTIKDPDEKAEKILKAWSILNNVRSEAA